MRWVLLLKLKDSINIRRVSCKKENAVENGINELVKEFKKTN